MRKPIVTRIPFEKVYGYIYLTTCLVNGVQYIGQHKCCNGKPNDGYIGSGKIISRAIKRYGKSSFTCEILNWAPTKEALDALEQFYIELYDAVASPKFYNIHPGGTGGDNFTGRSETEKAQFRRKYQGANNPFYGKVWDEEHMQRFHEASAGANNSMYGKPVTGERLKKITEKVIELQGRPIVQLTLSGEFVQEFSYIQQPHRLYPEKFGACGVGECCRHHTSTAYGYKWMYKSEYEQLLKEDAGHGKE